MNIVRLFFLVFFNVVTINVYAQNHGSALQPMGDSPSNVSSNPGTATHSDPLSMAGWHLESNPKVSNPNLEYGKIVYAVEIDSVGDLLSIKVLEKTISDELAKKCETELRKLFFIKNRGNTSTAATIKGTITFLFRVE